MMPDFRNWPGDFTNRELITGFDSLDASLVELCDWIIDSGGSIRVWGATSFAFLRDKRTVDFVWRGRLRRGSENCWEVSLLDGRESFRLGTIFGIRENACVVVSGIDDIRDVTECWLGGSSLTALVNVATFWDKMNVSRPLQLLA